MEREREYTIFDATIEVFSKIIRFIARIAIKIVKWAYEEF